MEASLVIGSNASLACVSGVADLTTDGLILSAALQYVLSANLTYANNKNVYDICVVEKPKTIERKH